MQTRENKQTSETVAMGFYHEDGFVAAHQQARRFAKEGGRIATLPDIINARLHTRPVTNSDMYQLDANTAPWQQYYTTMSAEYMGFTRKGNRIMIVAHGVGPMATEEGYSKPTPTVLRTRSATVAAAEFLARSS